MDYGNRAYRESFGCCAAGGLVRRPVPGDPASRVFATRCADSLCRRCRSVAGVNNRALGASLSADPVAASSVAAIRRTSAWPVQSGSDRPTRCRVSRSRPKAGSPATWRGWPRSRAWCCAKSISKSCVPCRRTFRRTISPVSVPANCGMRSTCGFTRAVASGFFIDCSRVGRWHRAASLPACRYRPGRSIVRLAPSSEPGRHNRAGAVAVLRTR